MHDTSLLHSITSILCDLAPNRSRYRQARMHIAEEASRIGLNLTDLEICPIVFPIGAVGTGLERTFHAACANPLIS